MSMLFCSSGVKTVAAEAGSDQSRPEEANGRMNRPTSQLVPEGREKKLAASAAAQRNGRGTFMIRVSVRLRRRPGFAAAYPDRKSTRLNSSHRCISYAVF